MEPSGQTELNAAIERLWLRFLPEIRERVAVLESAAGAFAAHALTAAQQDDAHAAAHKLAGVLGTFKLAHGTDLARELELLYSESGNSGLDAGFGPRLAALAAELRATVESRK